MVCGAILGGVFMPFVGGIPTMEHMLLFLIVGLTGAVGQYLFSSALKYAPASVIAPFNYTALIWASILDIIIWSAIPGWPIFVGAGIILAAKLYVLHRENLKKKASPPNAKE